MVVRLHDLEQVLKRVQICPKVLVEVRNISHEIGTYLLFYVKNLYALLVKLGFFCYQYR